jgi:hypothetical protein
MDLQQGAAVRAVEVCRAVGVRAGTQALTSSRRYASPPAPLTS